MNILTKRGWFVILLITVLAVIATATTYIVVQDPNTVQVKSQTTTTTITTIGIIRTTLTKDPNDPNVIDIIVRLKKLTDY